MARNKRRTTRDHPMKYIEEFLARKKQRKVETRPHPLDEKFGLPSTTESSNPSDGFISAPQVSTITIPLDTQNGIYQAGMTHQGGVASNLGEMSGFEEGDEILGVDGNDCLRVIADKEGIHKWGVSTLMVNDNGQFSVWVYGRGSVSGEDYEYVLSVHQDSYEATPVDEESLVIRWEYDDSATPVSVLRLYPNLTVYPGTFVEIELDESEWQDEGWHKILATWSYQHQLWTLKWDDTEGILTQPDTVPFPNWDEFTQVDIFTDLNFENVIYHYNCYIVVGPITDPDALGIPKLVEPLAFFFTDLADETFIAGYQRLRRAIPAGLEATLIQTGKDTDGEMLLGSFITSTGVPGTEVIPAGHWSFFLFTHVDNAAFQSYIKVYVYKRSAGGVETELFNVTSGDIDELIVTEQQVIYHQVADISLLETDRIVVKLFFYTTRPANVQMTFTYDGAVHISHLHTPFASGISPDSKVAVDDAATPGFLGATSVDGVLRTTGMTYIDGGDHITISPDCCDLDGTYDIGRLIDFSSGNGPVKLNFPDGGVRDDIVEVSDTYHIRNLWIQANEGDILNVSTLYYTETDDLSPEDFHIVGIMSTDSGTNKYLRWRIASSGFFQGTGFNVRNYPTNSNSIHSIGQSGVTFNVQGDNIDFHIESVNNANMFNLDAANDTVGIDESAPDANVSLHVGSDGFAATGKGIRNDHPPRARMYLDQVQDNMTANAWAKIILNADDYDSDNITDLVNSRITPGVAGYYQVEGSITWDAGFAAGNRMGAKLRVNNATDKKAHHDHAGGTSWKTVHVSDNFYMSDTDYVELFGRPGTAGNTADVRQGSVNTNLYLYRTS